MVLFESLKRAFALDSRSCALFRVLLAVVLMGDLYSRTYLMETHYTDKGPARYLFYPNWRPYMWDFAALFHGLSYSLDWQVFCFGFHFICTIPLLIGWNTRFFCVVQWILQASLAVYAPVIRSGADQVFAFATFFSIFLPMGDHFSLDAALQYARDLDFDESSRTIEVPKRKSPAFHSWVNLPFLVQIILMYAMNCYKKDGPLWLHTDAATKFSLELKFFETSLTGLFKNNQHLLLLLNFFVLRWELWGPFFFVLPLFPEYSRLFGCISFIMMHISFGLALRIGEFVFAPQSTLSSLFPALFWDKIVLPILQHRKPSLQIYIHDTSTSRFLVSLYCTCFTTSPIYLFCLGSENNETWLEVECEQKPRKGNWNALHELLFWSPILWPLSFFLDSPSKRQRMYRFSPILTQLASTVHSVSTRLTLANPFKESFVRKSKLPFAAYFVYLSGVLVLWNISTMHQFPHWSNRWMSMPPNQLVMASSSLWQWWDMFAPQPPSNHWWCYIECQRADHSTIELFRNGGLIDWQPSLPSHAQPANLHRSLHTHRNFKYFENAILNNPGSRMTFAQFVCEQYNRRHWDNPIIIGQLTVVTKPMDFNAEVQPTVTETLLQSWDCRVWSKGLMERYPQEYLFHNLSLP